jgi:hypothetical protein
MTDNTGMDDFMSITSGDGATSEPEIQHEPHQRDEAGRFAPKVEEPAPAIEPSADTLVQHEEPHNQGNIPPARLKAEAEKRREAEADAAALRREIAELRGMVTATRQPVAQPQQEAAPATLWDDPDAYLKNQLSPIQSALLNQKAEFSKMIAVEKHGEEVFSAAENALETAAGTPEGQAFIQKLREAAHPAEELIKWHKQQQNISRVGNDPDAWLNAEIEKRLNDPAFLAQAVERHRAGGASNTNASRSPPLTNIPPSLSRIPSGGNAAPAGDESDGALFSSLTSGRR